MIRRPLPIRTRLVVTFAVLFAIILSALVVVLLVSQWRSELGAVDRVLSIRSSEVVELVDQKPSGGELDLPQIPPERVSSAVAVVSDQGHVIAVSDGHRAFRSWLAHHDVTTQRTGNPTTVDDMRIIVRKTVPEAGGQPQFVVAGTPITEPRDIVLLLAAKAVTGAVVALLLATLMTAWLTRKALQPVDRMRSVAAQMAASSDSSMRLDEPAADDELRDLARTLNGMLDSLHRSMRRERSLFEDASHELRTPVTTARIALENIREILEGPNVDATRVAENLGHATDAVERLALLSESLLLRPFGDSEQIELHVEVIDVRESLDMASIRFTERAARYERTIIVQGDQTTIRTDHLRLGQILDNLIDNALRHGRGDITLTCSMGDTAANILISDSGEVDTEYADTVFDRGESSDTGRRSGGLGLDIARRLARQLNGDLHLASAAPTTFQLDLPDIAVYSSEAAGQSLN